jgi:hypothetical protein
MRKCRIHWSLESVLATAISIETCVSMSRIPYVNYTATINVSAGHILLRKVYEKVVSLMTGLDYGIERSGTVNGLAYVNYYRECTPDFGEEVCTAMAKKHATNDQQIYHPDNGIAINFIRSIDSDERISVNVVIENKSGAINIKVTFVDAIDAGGQPSSGFSKAAVGDFSKMVASFTRSYGADHVSATPPH